MALFGPREVLEMQAFASNLASLALAAALVWAGSQNGMSRGGIPLLACCGALAFALNWAAFVPAYLAQTERYFDLMGSATYVVLTGVALAGGEPSNPRALLLAMLVSIWALRLGSFLFRRIRTDGSDGRFDRLKPSFSRFLTTWTLQGLWVVMTLGCALAAMTSLDATPLGWTAVAGTALWLAGFAIEVVADHQKRRFRHQAGSTGSFIAQGLWAWARHPNYFGEIALWTGIALISLPALSGWQHATLVSPLFVYVLLTRISGIPLLEARGLMRWGDDPAYLAYLERTPRLIPWPPASTGTP
jgi:steroid 5-alpha reductase family enzyme